MITSGDKIKAAEDAGADFVGSDDIIAKIAGGWLDFDRVIASPDMMGKLGRIGRVLGRVDSCLTQSWELLLQM